jgi:tryptophan 2,3-dioxygenase
VADTFVNVTGLPELEAALGRMSGFQTQQVREQAILAGGRSLVRPTRAAAPLGPTGNLRKKVGARKARIGKHGQRDPAIVIVGSVAPHRHLVIRGTKPRFTKAGAARGVMPANPFVDRAWRANEGQVMARIRAVYAAEVQKLWRR